jgi:4-hydroxy-3-polyprenylbenzoate decarboxylase
MSVYVTGISGASGAPYAKRVVQGLLAAGHEVKCVITEAGRRVLDVEEGVRLSGVPEADLPVLREWVASGPSRTSGTAGAPGDTTGPGRLELLDEHDVAAPIASGSYPVAGMAVVPCSTGTLARIAHGVSSGLLERAADVCLKERRKLVLVPRETPLSIIHLRNMVAATEAGALVLPAMPGFYHRPRSVQDLVDFVAARVLVHLGVESAFLKQWTGPVPDALGEPGRVGAEKD